MAEVQFWIGVHGVVTNGHKLLVLRRSETMAYKPGHWDLPGGHLALDESFEECLMREVEEETGLKVEIGPLLALIRRPSEPFVQALYSCRPSSATPVSEIRLRPDEHSEARWVTANELHTLSPLIPYLEQLVHCDLLVKATKSLAANF
jgi:8-oxo-dGTP pyrophosphatase MutT (NUDIX family)